MAERKPFLLRLPADLLDELNAWARDDLRSLNAQIEFLLRQAVHRHRRESRPLIDLLGKPPHEKDEA